VELRDEQLLVEWATISEKNSESFDIEFSEDAIHFTSLLNVPAEGNSNKLKVYKHFVADTFKTNKFYVGLKQNDKNGLFTYSPVVYLSSKEINNFKLMPNPSSSGILRLSANQKTKPDSYFEVLDYTGKMILKEAIRNAVTFINLSSFGSGIYLVQIHSGGNTILHKVIYN